MGAGRRTLARAAATAEYAGTPIERFTAFDLDGWTPVSRNQLVVWSGPNEAYLLKAITR